MPEPAQPTPEDILRLANYAMRQARLRGLQQADRDDIFAELCLFGVRQAASFDAGLSSFATHFLPWAIKNARAMRNDMARWRRKGNARIKLFSEINSDLEHFAFGVEDVGLARVEDRDSVANILPTMAEHLNEREIDIVILRAVYELTHKEISERHGISLARAWQIERKALKKLTGKSAH
jgi:RNA polymerase sigma factor (sigma-70 family)